MEFAGARGEGDDVAQCVCQRVPKGRRRDAGRLSTAVASGVGAEGVAGREESEADRGGRGVWERGGLVPRVQGGGWQGRETVAQRESLELVSFEAPAVMTTARRAQPRVSIEDPAPEMTWID